MSRGHLTWLTSYLSPPVTANSSVQQDGLYLLDTANGDVQTLLSGPSNTPPGWHDATHLSVSQAKADTETSAQELSLLVTTGE